MAQQELDEVGVQPKRERNPGLFERVRRSGELAGSSVLRPLQAALNPSLFRERTDTDALMRTAFGEGGQLEELRQSDPELYQALQDASDSPMQATEHRKFRSAILDMIEGEVRRKQEIDATLADNGGYMRVLSLMDQAIPGMNDPDLKTFEEGERETIQADFERAQTLAQAGDAAGSKAIMTEVKKRGDLLTANIRQRMEQDRKRATIDDATLYQTSDNAAQALRDASQDLDRAIAKNEKDGTPIPDFVLQKALSAYGAAGSLQQVTPGQAAAAAAGGAITGGGAGAAGGLPGILIGAGVGAAGVGISELRDYFKSKKNITALSQQLRDSQMQVASNYAANRQKLAERYAPLGIKFGEQQGEVYAVLADAYKAEADKIPTAAPRTAEETNADRVESHRTRLTKEAEKAKAALEAARPDAAANLPNADRKLADANARAIQAQDDLLLFEDELARGGNVAEVASGDQLQNIRDARQRRKARADALRARDRQEGMVESLRSRLR